MTGTGTTEVTAADTVAGEATGADLATESADDAVDSAAGRPDALDPDADAELRLSTDERHASTARGTIRSPATDDGSTGWGWKVLAGLGVVTLGVAVAVVADPRLVPRLRADTVRTLRTAALVLGGIVGLVGLMSAYHRDGNVAPDAGPEDVEQVAPPASAETAGHDVPGSRLDDAVEAIGGRAHGTDDVYTAGKVRSSLRGLAIRVISRTAECSEERAADHVHDGTWTEDVRAAAFLAREGAADRPLSMRIRDWASGRSFERQVEATVGELAARMGVDES